MVMKPNPSTQELMAWTTAPGAGVASGGGMAGRGTMSSWVPPKPAMNWTGWSLLKLTISHRWICPDSRTSTLGGNSIGLIAPNTDCKPPLPGSRRGSPVFDSRAAKPSTG